MNGDRIAASTVAWLMAIAVCAAVRADGQRGDVAPSARTGDSSARALVLLVTGQNNGTFEPCGCAGSFRGGLVRRATVFTDFRSRFSSTVALDTGDQTAGFSLREEFGPRREIRERTDAAIMEGMAQLDYDAVLVGDNDLDWGLARYRARYGGLSMVASNVSAEGETLGEPLRVIETPAGRVAVVGLVAPEALALLDPKTRVGLQVADPVERATTLLAEVRADVVVALTVGGPAFDAALARSVPRIDVIVSQHGHGLQHRYDADADAVRIESPRNGLEVAALELRIAADGAITEVKREAVLIEPGIPREPHLDEVFSALTYTVERLKLVTEHDFRRGTQAPADACRECHQPQHAFWAAHPHARALEPLAAEGRVEDALCLPCHVSGFEEDRGFTNLSDTPTLAGVTCTMCHAVDLAVHAKDDRPPTPKVPLEACLMCHTRRDSPRFEDEEAAYLKAASCPKSD